MLDPSVTLNFDLLFPKLETFILVPKCTNAENLEKICPILFKTLCYQRSRNTVRQTHKQSENCLQSHYVGGGIKNNITAIHEQDAATQ